MHFKKKISIYGILGRYAEEQGYDGFYHPKSGCMCFKEFPGKPIISSGQKICSNFHQCLAGVIQSNGAPDLIQISSREKH